MITNLWFSEDNQVEKLLGYVPPGRIYTKARVAGSNFHKLIQWISSGFLWLIRKYNTAFQGMFVCESHGLIKQWKTDYGIPNDLFYEASDQENMTDVFVLRYLMKGNTIWNFQAIASIYGIDAEILSGIDEYPKHQFPYEFPLKFIEVPENLNNLLVIRFFYDKEDAAVVKRVEKIKRIYNIIKQASCKIEYKEIKKEYVEIDHTDYFPVQFPFGFGEKKERKVIKEIKLNVVKIDFSNCKGVGL